MPLFHQVIHLGASHATIPSSHSYRGQLCHRPFKPILPALATTCKIGNIYLLGSCQQLWGHVEICSIMVKHITAPFEHPEIFRSPLECVKHFHNPPSCYSIDTQT